MSTPPPPPPPESPTDVIRALRDIITGAMNDKVKEKIERRGGLSDPILDYVRNSASSIIGDAAERIKAWYEENRPPVTDTSDDPWREATDDAVPPPKVAALRTEDGNHFDLDLREEVAAAIRRYSNTEAPQWIGPEAVLSIVEKHLAKSNG